MNTVKKSLDMTLTQPDENFAPDIIISANSCSNPRENSTNPRESDDNTDIKEPPTAETKQNEDTQKKTQNPNPTPAEETDNGPKENENLVSREIETTC